MRTRVQVWHRRQTPEESLASAIATREPRTDFPTPAGADEDQWQSGRWERVIFDGVVDTMNALEYAYQNPVAAEHFKELTAAQVFD